MARKIIIRAGMLLGMLLAVLPAGAQKDSLPPAKTQLVFWHAWPEDQVFLEKLGALYEAQTQVQVSFRAFPASGGRMAAQIQSAAQTHALPDLLGVSDDPGLLAVYVRSGLLKELTPALQAGRGAWENSFHPQAIRALSFGPGNPFGIRAGSIWGVPLSVKNIQWYYNRLLFQKAGLNPDVPPQTWEEFTSVCQALRAAGITPLAAGFRDAWVSQSFFRAYTRSLLGDDKMRSLYKGTMPYLAPECQQVLNYFSELRNKGCLYPGSATRTSREAEGLFAAQKTAMLMDGSWAAETLTRLSPMLDFGVMAFPRFKEATFPLYAIGGLQQGAVITAQSRNAEAALDFLRWLTADAQQELWVHDREGSPALAAAEEFLGPKLKPFSPGLTELPPDLNVEERRDVLEALSRGMRAIITGEAETLDVLRQVQKIKSAKPQAQIRKRK